MSAIKTVAPMIGDVFEDRHPKERGRRLKLVADDELDARGRQRFAAETIRNDGRQHLVGRRTTVSAHVLAKGSRRSSATTP